MEVVVFAGETTVLPARDVAATQRGIRSALAGTPDSISDRLWAYEIEQAARVMLDQQGLAERILIRTNGETICFTPAAGS